MAVLAKISCRKRVIALDLHLAGDLGCRLATLGERSFPRTRRHESSPNESFEVTGAIPNRCRTGGTHHAKRVIGDGYRRIVQAERGL